ncbi:CDP-alcohol phosphatidyltransferase family protein [uncultured Eubacterium sp.]|uniref:CDP-alcohol phosphatidyltransferase family protein n=1 Tax=uncultured Eubacterium sp. TaxID=165185 RepID=UPI002674142A|nr:CDP-alcohol phosphatidyltransferase family protein [uncultured Eubacterium sp.]
MDKNFWHEYFSIPNLMGYFRIFLVFVYMVLFYRSLSGAPYWPVIITIVISGLTDFFDGKIARKFNMITEWGKVLDPIADKITIGAIILSLCFKYRIIIAMAVLYIVKEGFMAIAGMVSIKRGHKVEGAMWYGKVCTFGTYIILILLLLYPAMNIIIVDILVGVNMVIMLFTFINYILYYGRVIKGLSKNMESLS